VGDDWVEYKTVLSSYSSPSSAITVSLSLDGTAGTIAPGEYVAFDVTASCESTVNLYARVEVEFSHNTGTFGHLCVPNLYEKRDAVGGIRPIAGAGMLSPNSALFNRQGLVRGVQLPPGQDWLTTVRGGFNGLNTAEGMWNGTWTKGIYGFIKPVGVAEFEMQSPFFKLSELGPYSPVTDASHPLRMGGGQVLLWAKCDLQTLGSGDVLYAAGQSYTTTLRCLEFRTLDTWFKQDVPALDQEELEVAMRLIAHMPQFHENFLHVAAITGFLRTAATAGQFAFKHLPGIVKALPIIGEGIHKVRELFSGGDKGGGPEVHAMPKGYRTIVHAPLQRAIARPPTKASVPMLTKIIDKPGGKNRVLFTGDDAKEIRKYIKEHNKKVEEGKRNKKTLTEAEKAARKAKRKAKRAEKAAKGK